jgi:spoIIIJ-associated protein
MDKISVTAATHDKALAMALEQLHITREALQYRVDRSEEEYLLDTHRPTEVTVIAWIRPEYVADQVRDFLQKLTYQMGFTVEVRMKLLEDRIMALMASPSSSILIGKNGSTLDAIQYLTTRVASRGGRVVPPIMVDIENYKERKCTRLERIARRTAQKVLAENHEIALPAMTAADRKIIHTALKDFQGVTTYSQGPEGDRYVVVAPGHPPAEVEKEI